jgi:hypothetical protein
MRIGQLDEIQELLDDGARIVERWRVARGGGEEREEWTDGSFGRGLHSLSGDINRPS